MAVVAYGEPLVEIHVPQPELRPGTALIEVLTCGVCFSDVKTSHGQMPFSPELTLPHVPGHEICGRVLATDPPGLYEPGELVVVYHYWPCGRCRRCRAGDEVLCLDLKAWIGFTDPGGFQERLVVPLGQLVQVRGLDPVEAATVNCALGTAYRAVVTRAQAAPGSTIAVVGLGGVGIHALQVAAAAGSIAVGLDPSARAREVAAGLRVPAYDTAGFEPAVTGLEPVEEEGFDAVVVTAGAPAAYRQAAEIVRKGGRIVCVGYTPDSEFRLATPRLVLEEIVVLGSRYVKRAELERAVELVRRGQVKPVVHSLRPLGEVNDAYDDLTSGRVVGRTVLRVADALESHSVTRHAVARR
jgi:D-arabinose 1-dehydrogenase-like Zn-dependent alcohol dehydrogenase